MPENASITEERVKTSKKKTALKSSESTQIKGRKDRELFLQWSSIPAMLRLLRIEELEKMGYDIHDPVFLKMLSIRKKGDFCREFKVGVNQPARWENSPGFWDEVNALSDRNHVMKFRKDVDFSFTQKVIKHGDAHRMKLWKQIYEGWNERTENVNVNVDMTPADLVKEIETRNAKIRGDLGIPNPDTNS